MNKNIVTENEVNAKIDTIMAQRYNHTLHMYIDITGDLIAGTLLSQILYWFSKDKNGKSKLRIFKDGYFWIAKERDSWYSEIRITKRQYDRAIKLLTKSGFVELKKYKFNSLPTIHIRPNYDKINSEINKWKEVVRNGIIADDVDSALRAEYEGKLLKTKVEKDNCENEAVKSNGNNAKGKSLGNNAKRKTGIAQSGTLLTMTTNNDYINNDYDINASNPKGLNGDNINASFPEEKRAHTPFLDMNNCTLEELENHYYIRCKKIAGKHNITDTEKIRDAVHTIGYFCQEYYKTFGEHHPVLSDRSLERVFINFCFPTELLEQNGITTFEHYQEMIDRYFGTEYGKYNLSGIVPDYSISHFMSEEILINLCKNVFGIPHL